ncbi:UDP-N-acetylmuramoyl-tripeptide--D-alanyl-D-alanine ligase [Amnibacterium flavum]|uniref:UDP-N-acetylmuramoyl-tripeptide--D-alanyl-D-alanine ligase n=1 Tax=Amnibacterium flavum TaxID=2173173 RepID=A0A2V1HPX7_9MICO|nr:UDP-N-acetylmuramoyl-tripeptide--D-alanyl-D-alanine ligase [Amnibacterium flavum]PVZ94683.1 UDP-N-acetylmuramoylalanyl-D-glutamate--2,6-diaminopimelate ligase [Amnibacterium flavum]
MIALSFTEIAEAVGGRLLLGDGDAAPSDVVSGAVETDSREIGPGGVFVARHGETTDGHLFAPSAIERGAALLIVERPLELSVTQIVVDDATVALGLLAAEVVRRVRAAGVLRIVAVTGSNGKTTTKNLLREILSRRAETIAPRESFNNEVGAPLTMLKLTWETEFLVAEMGASGIGEIRRLVGMARPDVGIVLTVGLAHAGEFGGIESTLIAKTEMVADLLPDDTAVLNADDFRVAGMAESTAAKVLWFGRGPQADVRASDVSVDSTGTRFTLHAPGETPRDVHFSVLGEHHVTNALAAAAASLTLGVPLDTIVEALESVTRAERWRMEVLPGLDTVVINDAYNASPDSMAAALKTLAVLAPEAKRTVAVLGEMSELGDLSAEEHDSIGRLVVRLNIGQLIVVGEGAKRIHMAAELEGSWDGESEWYATADEAYDRLESSLRSGDLVLVKSSNSAGLRFLGDRLGELVACKHF